MAEIDELRIKVILDIEETTRETRILVRQQDRAARKITKSWQRSLDRRKKAEQRNAREHKSRINRMVADQDRAIAGAQAKWDKRFTSMRNIAGGAFLATGVAALALGKKMIQLASAAEQVESRFGAVFQGEAGSTAAELDKLADAVGRGSIALKSSAADFQAFFVGMDISRKEAAKLSAQLTTTSLDFASFHDIEDDEASNRFIQALSGSAEVLAKFGVNVKEAAVNQAVLAKGVRKTNAEITQQDKVLARIEIIMKSLGKQGVTGDAIRTADQFANVQKRLAAEVGNVAEKLGGDLLPVMAEVGAGWADLVKNFRNNQLGDAAEQASRVNIATGKMGIEIERVNSMLGVSARSGNDLSEVWQNLARNADGVAETTEAASLFIKAIVDDSDAAAKLTKKFGLSLEDLGKIAKGFGGDLEAYIENLKKAAVEEDFKVERAKQLKGVLEAIKATQSDGFTIEEKRDKKRLDVIAARRAMLINEMNFLNEKGKLDDKELERLNKTIDALSALSAERDKLNNKPRDQAGEGTTPDPFGGVGGRGNAESVLEDIRNRNKSELMLLEAKKAAELQILRVSLDNRLLTQKEFDAIELTTKEEFEKNKAAIEDKAREAQERKDAISSARKLRGAKDFFGNIASATRDGSKRSFEISKAASIAQGALNIPTAISGAFKVGAEIGGPVLGAAFGAAAGAAELINLNNIRSQSFGGGGGGGAAPAPSPVQPTAPGVAQPDAGGGGGGNGQTTITVETPGLEGLSPDSIITAGSAQAVLTKVNEALAEQGQAPVGG